MKKFSRFLSVTLVALMVLSLTASAVAETPAVKIPETLGKVKTADGMTVPTVDNLSGKFISLSVTTDSAKMVDKNGDPIMSRYCRDRWSGELVQATGHTDDGDIYLHFSPKPDWAGVIWAEGYENLEIDEKGNAVTSREGHLRQPGTWVANGPKSEGSWHVTGGDYAFMAGKTFSDGTSVSIQFGRSGAINYVEYTIPDADFFQTGMEGATATVKIVPVSVLTVCGPEDEFYSWDYFYYVASANVDYPAGNDIVRIETDWRNDTKRNLASYRISFATSETEVYKITYSPNSVTIFEDTYNILRRGRYMVAATEPCLMPGENGPSGSGLALHTYYADDPIYGEYYKNGELKAVSGSGDDVNNWYKPGHGKQAKGLLPVKSFKTPRVY